MPKSISCVICCKRVTTACRRSMKGKRNEMQRQNLGALIGKRITENDYICTKCILEHQRGHLQKKLPPPGCSLSPDHDIFYMRGNTDKKCSICNFKKTTLNWFQMKPAQTFFLRHSIIFPDKARACFSHMSSDRKQIWFGGCKIFSSHEA